MTKTFEEWRQLAKVAESNGMDVAAESHRLLADMLEQRAALLADRPDVDALVDEIVTAARLQQFYDDPRFKPLSEQNWRAVDIAHKTIASRRSALESLAAQLAQRDEEIAKLKGHASTLHGCCTRALGYIPVDSSLFDSLHKATTDYRRDYPKDTP